VTPFIPSQTYHQAPLESLTPTTSVVTPLEPPYFGVKDLTLLKHFTMSASYSTQYYASGALPILAPSKGQHPSPSYYTGGDSTYSVSPPEDLDASVSSASGYGNSYSVPTSYAGSSQGEYESSAGSASGIDLNEYMQERFAATFDPIALDKCTAKQAQT
jgi:hypothetical protein